LKNVLSRNVEESVKKLYPNADFKMSSVHLCPQINLW